MLYDLGRQPRAARELFIKYQDRLLFGKDTFEPSEFPYYWRVFETADEYFDYYRDYHAFWKLYGLDLPDAGPEEGLLPERRAPHAGPAADRLAAMTAQCMMLRLPEFCRRSGIRRSQVSSPHRSQR